MTATPIVLNAADPSREAHFEQELLEGLLADDPDAWRTFNSRYSRLVHHAITKVLGRFSRVLGADETREVYSLFALQLLQNDKHKLRSYDPERGSRLGTWFSVLATHAAYDFLRSHRRAPLPGADQHAEHLASTDPDPLVCCEARERAERVTHLMSELSERDQEFVMLYFGEGLAPEQVAERMGISVKTVYSKKHKLRAKLEQLLASVELAA